MTFEPLDPPAVKNSGHRWLDLAVALTALGVSVLSIFSAQHTSESMEKLVHANSWPFLQIGSGNATDNNVSQLGFYIENVGTGPARIHSFDIEYDGVTLTGNQNHLYKIMAACCATELAEATARVGGDARDAVGRDLTSPVAARFLAPEDQIGAIRWLRTDENAEIWEALDQARQQGRITMSVCYCSVFDECWISRSHSFPPESVDQCEPAPAASRPARPN